MTVLARREAPAVVRKDRGTIGLRLSARHPPRVKPEGKPLTRAETAARNFVLRESLLRVMPGLVPGIQ